MKQPYIICIFLFILVNIACNKKDYVIENNDTLYKNLLNEKVKFWFENSRKSKLNTENNIKAQSLNFRENDITLPKINWEKGYINYDSSNTVGYTVPIIINKNTGEYLQLVTSIRNDSINGVIIRSLPDSGNYSINSKFGSLKDFTGSIFIYTISGKFLSKKIFQKGLLINNLNKQKNDTLYKSNSEICASCTLDDVYVTSIRQYQNLYDINYIFSLYFSGTHGAEYIPINVGGSEPIIENLNLIGGIKISVNNECLKYLLNQILFKQMNFMIMNNAYLKYGFDDKLYLEIIDQPDLISPQNGFPVMGYNSSTKEIDGTIHVTIVLNSTTNQTNESIYATILHEMTHAYLFSQGVSDTTENSIATNDFIIDMKNSILTLSPNFDPFNAYALAWAGLTNSNLFLSLPEDKQSEIKNAIGYQEAGNFGNRCQVNINHEQN